MNDETFERVRAYESCIVVSEKENKAFKYAVLGDEWIYLTENPPKNVVEEVSLKDIVSVDLVSENYFNIILPSFVGTPKYFQSGNTSDMES